MTSKIKFFVQNVAQFGRSEGSFLSILGIEKVDFSIFSKLFGSCFRCVWVLF